jgi:lipopolysaccharide/colanic/teichoic acid biosynthesis glycosyltransferase
MFFQAIAAITRFWQRPHEDALLAILNVEQTKRALHRERCRCDRSGGNFSLVCLTPRAGDHEFTARLLPLLAQRLRTTDEVGWLDEERIGVLLHDTDANGAWTVVQSIDRLLTPGPPRPVCEVYSYPYAGGGDPREVGPAFPKTAAPADEGPANVGQTAPLQALLARPLPVWKRCLDVVGATAALVLLSPVMLLIGLAIRLTSRGPALFAQRRAGLGGRPFIMYKFRTMVVDAEARKPHLRSLNEQDGPAFKLKDDPRITPLGRWLRRTSLDELPQLWNVLRGEMSLVGPRPLPCDESNACDAWHRRRLDVVPGLTCIWQVSGRCEVSFTEWMRMDMRYVHNQSLGQDLKLLLQTIPAVVARRGAQ